MSKHHHEYVSGNAPPGGSIHIGTAVVAHGGPHSTGTLPFTGADLGLYAVVGIAMIAAGVFARRGARR
jgi:hypothetical protein